jgi:hypothetical protein
MSKLITRQMVEEAIALFTTMGADFLPRFTVVELSQVLDIPLEHGIRCAALNKNLLQLDAQKNIIGVGRATGNSLKMSLAALYAWYANHVGVKPDALLTVKNQESLAKSTSGLPTFDPFVEAVCVFATESKDGANVRDLVRADHGSELASMVQRLATIRQPPPSQPSYYYGVVLDENSRAVIEKIGRKLFTPAIAQAAIAASAADGWHPYEVPTPVFGSRVAPVSELDEGDEGEAARVNRRTKEELLAERQSWAKELGALGVSVSVIKATVFEIPKHKDAEAAFQALLKKAKQDAALEQGTKTETQPPAKVETSPAPAPHGSGRRSTAIQMPEEINSADLKKDIVNRVRQETGIAPQPQSPVAQVAPAAPVAPSPAADLPPINAPRQMAAGAGAGAPAVATADSLLNDLLGAAGQKAN